MFKPLSLLILFLSMLPYVMAQNTNLIRNKMSEAFSKLRTEEIEQGLLEMQQIQSTLSENQDSLRADAHRYLGEFHNSMGDFDAAISEFTSALSLYEDLNFEERLSTTYSSLGNSYLALSRYDKAKKYYLLSQQYAEKFNDKESWARVSINLCNVLIDEKEFDHALEILLKTKSIFKDIDQFEPYAISTLMEANVYIELENLVEANNVLSQLEQDDRIQSNYYIMHNLFSIKATVAIKGKRYSEAITTIKKSIDEANRGSALNDVKNSYKKISEVYELAGNYLTSLMYYKKYDALKDSLLNEKNLESIARADAKFESTIKEKALVEKDLKIKDKELELTKEKSKKIYFISGAGLFLLLSFFVGYRYYLKRKSYEKLQNLHYQLEEKSEIIEDKNREITDSIKYAQNLQEAILPNLNMLTEFGLSDYFLIYQPKDIVAGDFYWSMRSNDGKNLLLAVADCTGHGVPGAMVSVICSSALEQAVRELGTEFPAKILDRTRELVSGQFSKKGSQMMDGMDISLAAIRSRADISGEQSTSMKWCGANNPLWIVRGKTGAVEEIKPDKQPIGKYEHEKPFTEHQLSLSKGDQIYLFSDGYADQFGTDDDVQKPGGKKFKTKNFKKLIAQNSTLEMNAQKTLLQNTFNQWKGDLEQIDDVCVIGVRL